MKTLLLLLCSTPLFAQNTRIYEHFQSSNGKEYSYAVNLPNHFDRSKTYPVLVGPNEGTPGSEKSFFWNVENTGEFGWILVEFPLWKESSTVVSQLLDHLKVTYHVEHNKFHMVGFSSSSANTFKLAMDIPAYFISVTGIPGHPRTKDTNQLKKLRSVKIQNIVGEKDGYWTSSAKEFDKLYEELGIDHNLEIVPNGQHVLRHLVGKGYMDRMEKMR